MVGRDHLFICCVSRPVDVQQTRIPALMLRVCCVRSVFKDQEAVYLSFPLRSGQRQGYSQLRWVERVVESNAHEKCFLKRDVGMVAVTLFQVHGSRFPVTAACPWQIPAFDERVSSSRI